MSAATPTVGVIGLGIMGGAIARNLVKAGRTVIGYDVDAARAQGIPGAQGAGNVAEIATADVVLTCLPHAKALEQTVAALRDSGRTPTVCELSTLPLDAKQQAAARLAERGITLLDCPLSGTGAQAERGDLAVYASGDAAAWQRCAPVFADFARVSHFLGAFGNGTKMKFVANLLVAIHNVAAAEAVRLGLEAGLDPATLVTIAGSGAGGSRMLDMRGPMMVAERFTPATMKLDVWQKDMDLIAAFAAAHGVATPLFSATAPLYAQACAAGWGDEDTAAVYKVLAGLPGPQ